MDIGANVERVRQTIAEAASRAGRDPRRITIVAATKLVAVPSIREAYDAGLRVFGENRLQEAQAKMAALADLPELRWHFIGRLQRRKLKAITGRFELVHSLESVEQARIIDRWAAEQGIVQSVLLEVNLGGEVTKGGFAPSEIAAALPELERCPHVSVQGLMAVPPLVDSPEASRPYFRELRRLADSLARTSPSSIVMKELSMGMSHDYPIAVEEGATMVRIGTAIFGPRTPVS